MKTGRPLEGDARMVPGSVRMTPAQWDKFRALGSGSWLRKMIERAKAPK